MLTAVPARRMALVWLIAAAFSISLVGLLASPVRAATIAVTTTADEYDAGASTTCSLREAIVSANTDTAFGGCTAGIGADVITVPAGTYLLTQAPVIAFDPATGDLDVLADVTINGAGTGATIIDGNDIDRVLIVYGSALNVAINGLTIRNGTLPGMQAGGGLALTTGLTALNGVVVSGNTAMAGGGIASLSDMTITNSTISGNTTSTEGGGILNGGTSLTITNSTISGNAANLGGGISSRAALNVTNSTISGNTAVTEGGGLRFASQSGNFVALNATITNNSSAAGGGVAIYTAPGLGTATFKNSIVANQLSGTNCGTAVADPGPSSAGNNLSSDASCAFGASGDQNSTPPQLGALAANGGPTLTHALLAGSPAIDTGNNTGCPGTDQRGNPRPTDGDGNGTAICDKGAFEVAGAAPPASASASASAAPSGVSAAPTATPAAGALPDTRSDDSRLDGPALAVTAILLAISVVAMLGAQWVARRNRG